MKRASLPFPICLRFPTFVARFPFQSLVSHLSLQIFIPGISPHPIVTRDGSYPPPRPLSSGRVAQLGSVRSIINNGCADYCYVSECSNAAGLASMKRARSCGAGGSRRQQTGPCSATEPRCRPQPPERHRTATGLPSRTRY